DGAARGRLSRGCAARWGVGDRHPRNDDRLQEAGSPGGVHLNRPRAHRHRRRAQFTTAGGDRTLPRPTCSQSMTFVDVIADPPKYVTRSTGTATAGRMSTPCSRSSISAMLPSSSPIRFLRSAGMMSVPLFPMRTVIGGVIEVGLAS